MKSNLEWNPKSWNPKVFTVIYDNCTKIIPSTALILNYIRILLHQGELSNLTGLEWCTEWEFGEYIEDVGRCAM